MMQGWQHGYMYKKKNAICRDSLFPERFTNELPLACYSVSLSLMGFFLKLDDPNPYTQTIQNHLSLSPGSD